jgi:excisionase family DNA binding protein
VSLISVEQAAEMLGVSRATAYRMIHDRLIPIVRILKRGVRVHREQLQQMIDAHAAASIQPAGSVGVSEETICPTKEKIPRTGGSLSQAQMEKEFAGLLAQATTPRRKR